MGEFFTKFQSDQRYVLVNNLQKTVLEINLADLPSLNTASEIRAEDNILTAFAKIQRQILDGTGGGGGTGTVESVSIGNLAPLFTSNVADSTVNPSISFTLSDAPANTYFGNSSGSPGSPSFNTKGNLTKTDDTNVTITIGGTPTGSMFNSVSLALGWTGTLAVSRGGTGSNTTLNSNRLIISSGGSMIEAPAIGADKVIISDSNGVPIASGVTVTELGFLSGLGSAVPVNKGGTGLTSLGSAYQILGMNSAGTSLEFKDNYDKFGLTVDGNGGVVSIGSKGYSMIPYDATIVSWYISGDTVGSTVIDLKRGGVSIVGTGNKPTLSGAQTANDFVSGWTSVSISANDLIEFNIESLSSFQRVNLFIKIIKKI